MHAQHILKIVLVTSFVAILSTAPSSAQFSLAPSELPDFPKDRVWFNSRPLAKADLQGKVVLFDFWTYSCINCIRTFPYLKSWYQKYHDMDFEIVGIHAPEFFFERDHNNVRKAIAQHGITWPVVLDNDNHMWNLFHNRFWPAKYLYGADGKFIMSHFGEGAYAKTEQAIQKALKKMHKNLSSDIKQTIQAENVDFASITTPEIYFGYERLEYSQNTNIEQNQSVNYRAPSPLPRNRFAFDGNWRVEAERAITTGQSSRIILRYKARKVNIVAGSLDSPVAFKLEVDGKPVPQKWQAEDAKNAIHDARLYRLIDTKTSQEHTLEIIFEKPGVEVYTFTFG